MYSVRPSTRSTVCATTRLDFEHSRRSALCLQDCTWLSHRRSKPRSEEPKAPRGRDCTGHGEIVIQLSALFGPDALAGRTCDSKSHCLLVSSTVWRRPRTSRTIVLRHKSPLGALELECGPLSGSVRFAEYNGIYLRTCRQTYFSLRYHSCRRSRWLL